METIEKELKSKGTITKKVTFPMIFFEDDFEKDCIANFNNTYYSKIMFDHNFRKQFESISALIVQDLVELKEQVFELSAQVEALADKYEEEPKEEKIKRKTFGE